MKTLFKTFIFSVSLITCAAAFADEQLTVQAHSLKKISPHVYAYVGTANGHGGNAGVIIGDDSVMVVDALVSAREGRNFLKDIKAVTDKPVKYVVNTHYHFDHALGNCEFVKQGAIVIAQERVKESFARTGEVILNPEKGGLTKADIEGTTLVIPNIYFSDRMFVNLGGVTVALMYLGPSHDQASITAYVQDDKTLFTGDIVFNKCHPFMGEGDLDNWPAALDFLTRLDTYAIVPGHGPLVNSNDIMDMKEYLRQFNVLAMELCKDKKVEDAPAIAAEMLKRLPEQKRTEFPFLVEMNLKFRYLPQPERTK